MAGKKASRGSTSQVSAPASGAAGAAGAQAGSRSAILRSSFSPSEYQLSLFASVIQGLDSQHLRLHDTHSGRLRSKYAIGSRATINSLDWGFYGAKHGQAAGEEPKRKRKRSSGAAAAAAATANGVGGAASSGMDPVVAFGTSESAIHMYSPAQDKIVATLKGLHEGGVRDFKFTGQAAFEEGWSIGGDGKLVQWDLLKLRSKRYVSPLAHAGLIHE